MKKVYSFCGKEIEVKVYISNLEANPHLAILPAILLAIRSI